MAEFHEIGSSQFTDVTPTGDEKIQISASQRTTLQNIANLAPAKGVKQVVVTNFQTNAWTLSDGGSVNFRTDIKVGEIVTFTSAKAATNGPSIALFGYAIKHNSLMASYVGMTTSNKVNGIPTIYTYKSAGVYATAWQQLPDASVKTVEITDFAIPGLNITKDGESFLFYANDASNIPNSNHGATSFVGVAIASPIFITGDQRLLYYMMVDTAKAMFYTGYANLEDDTVTWSDTPVTRLGQAVQVTAFTEPALSALLYSYKPGDFIPFFTNSVTASEENQFPESGIFNGFISMGSNEGDYFQILAFKTGSNKAYLGACIGSTTQWTQIGGSSAVEKLSTWLEQGIEVAPHINIGSGEVQVPLNRALKESDILRIDFMRRSEASTFYMQGVAIVHVGAVDNSIQGYGAALDEQYVDYGTGEFAALAFNAGTKLIGHNYFNLHIDTNGSVPQDDYYIMGVYNISGK